MHKVRDILTGTARSLKLGDVRHDSSLGLSAWSHGGLSLHYPDLLWCPATSKTDVPQLS